MATTEKEIAGSTRCHRRSEDVCVLPFVIPELELGDIRRRYLAETLWKVPTMPHFTSDQNLSMVRVRTAPTT